MRETSQQLKEKITRQVLLIVKSNRFAPKTRVKWKPSHPAESARDIPTEEPLEPDDSFIESLLEQAALARDSSESRALFASSS